MNSTDYEERREKLERIKRLKWVTEQARKNGTNKE